MKKVFSSFIVLVSCFFFCQSVLAGEEVIKPASRTWEEFSNPEKIIGIEEFLDGGYQEAFWRQVGKINDQFKTSPALSGPTYWAQLGARYLAWHLEFKKNHLINHEDGLSGQSNCYAISLMNNPVNDLFLNRLKETKIQEKACSSTILEMVDELNKESLPLLDVLGNDYNLLIIGYDADTNQLRVDKRFLLPPGVWMVLLNHQERHAIDDIYIGNKIPTDIERLIELDAAAIADGVHTWKIFRDDFLKIWTDKGLDFKVEYVVTKICLADILLAEPMFEKDLENKKIGYLKEYSRKLFLR